jgi:RNA polymerase sigma factor (sigma-70 family)
MANGRFDLILAKLGARLHSASAETVDDAQLLGQFAVAGDETAFAVLVRRHGPMVRRVCRSVLRNDADADDAFQATFLVLARRAGSISRRELLAGWLYGTAYRTARKAVSQAARRQQRERSVMPETSTIDPAAEAARQEWQPIVHEELNRLPERFRGPLILCYLEG